MKTHSGHAFRGISLALFGLLSLTASTIAGCGDVDDEYDDWSDEETELGEESFDLTTAELAGLLMGSGDFSVMQGYRPTGGHAGIDFGRVLEGVTQVRSPVHGTIIANTAECGKVAIFDGNNTVILAHMTNRAALNIGTQISMGTLLGRAGNVTGGGCTSSGAHLHIEIRVGSNPSMAHPANNNTNTTLNPLTYSYPGFPAVSLIAPNNGTSIATSPVAFSWSAIQGATSYRLQVSRTSSFDVETCIGGCQYNTAASTTARSVALGTGTWYWRVRAGNSGQGGNWSTVRSLTRR